MTDTSSAPMSMPSSSAFVETTARTLPSRRPRLDLAPPVRQVAAAIAAHMSGPPGAPSKSSFRYVVRISVASRLCAKTMSCRLRSGTPAPRAASSRQIRSPDAQLLVDHRRVHEQEELLAARRAVVVDELERLLGQPLGELARVGDRRGRADERRIRPVVPADRCSRRRTLARWLPKTPRYACSSSITT